MPVEERATVEALSRQGRSPAIPTPRAGPYRPVYRHRIQPWPAIAGRPRAPYQGAKQARLASIPAVGGSALLGSAGAARKGGR